MQTVMHLGLFCIGDSHEADILGAMKVGMHAIHFAAAKETPH